MWSTCISCLTLYASFSFAGAVVNPADAILRLSSVYCIISATVALCSAGSRPPEPCALSRSLRINFSVFSIMSRYFTGTSFIFSLLRKASIMTCSCSDDIFFSVSSRRLPRLLSDSRDC